MSESDVRWPRRAVNIATPSWTAEQKYNGADWDVFIAGRPHGSMSSEGGEALIRDRVWREVGLRVVASTGCEPIAEAPGNVNVGVTVHCGCGVWTDDVRVAAHHPAPVSDGPKENATDWQPFDGTFREGVEYRSRNDEALTYADSNGRITGFPHHCECQYGPMWYSDGGTACNGYTDFDITHQRRRPAETPAPAPQPAAGREGVERFCRACNKPLLPENNWMSDGCPCNCERGTNHGLVSKEICTCDDCSPVEGHDAAKLVELFNGIAPGVEWLPLSERLIAIQGFLRHGGWFSTQHEFGHGGSSRPQLPSVNGNHDSLMRQNTRLSEDIATLTAERDRLRATNREWLFANGPGGWIDDLRTQLAEANAKLDRIKKTADADEADLKAMRDGTKMTRYGIVQMLAYQQEDIAELKGKLSEANQRCEAAEREVERLERSLQDWCDTADAIYQAVPEAYRRGQLPENGNRKPSEMVREVLSELTTERDRLAGELEAVRMNSTSHAHRRGVRG